MTAYFVFMIGACLFGAAALAYDSYAERRERRTKKHHKPYTEAAPLAPRALSHPSNPAHLFAPRLTLI